MPRLRLAAAQESGVAVTFVKMFLPRFHDAVASGQKRQTVVDALRRKIDIGKEVEKNFKGE